MILVTGASGFLGSEIVRQLVRSGEKIRILHRKNSNLSHLEDIQSHLEFFEGDILDIPSLETAFEGVHQIYHSAAIIGYDQSYYDAMYKANIEGTANVVNTALARKVNKLLHVSSIAALGGRPDEQITEDVKWENNRWTTHYGITKMLAEREVWRGMQEGLESIIINPGIIIGVGHDEHKATLRLFKRIATGKLPFYTNGSNGFVDVEDVAKIAIRLMNQKFKGKRYIVISSNVSFKDYFKSISKALKVKTPKWRLNSFTGKMFSLLDWIFCKVSNRKRSLTSETLKVSLEKFTYSNQKIMEALDYDFIPLDITIKKVADNIAADL